jgi:biopolymer transport protein ExbD|tara:strand:+ start:1249 stop:1686 length:438 start_codon:yes stop_codon:yes gene_type:complete
MARRGLPTSAINANMTPMIDVTFLLIVFFVVVSQIVDRDAIPLDLPSPNHAASGILDSSEHVTVNLVPLSGGEISEIVVGGHTIAVDAMDELTSIVNTRLQGGATDVHLRADRATKYSYIHQAIEAIRAVGTTPRVQLVVDGEYQ